MANTPVRVRVWIRQGESSKFWCHVSCDKFVRKGTGNGGLPLWLPELCGSKAHLARQAFLHGSKEYFATVKMGTETDTQDVT